MTSTACCSPICTTTTPTSPRCAACRGGRWCSDRTAARPGSGAGAGGDRRLPPGHLDPERAAQAAALIEPAVVVPIHWGTLARAWARRPADVEAPVREFAARLQELAPGVELRVLAPGESTAV